MDTRRDFLKKTMLLSGAAGMATLPPSIVKAFSINPDDGTTFLDRNTLCQWKSYG